MTASSADVSKVLSGALDQCPIDVEAVWLNRLNVCAGDAVLLQHEGLSAEGVISYSTSLMFNGCELTKPASISRSAP
jgi:hypothetical protein